MHNPAEVPEAARVSAPAVSEQLSPLADLGRERAGADEPLCGQLRQMLKATGRSDLANLEIRVRPDSISVCGLTQSFFLRQLAIEAVRRLSGSRQIDDQIEVDLLASRDRSLFPDRSQK